MRKNAVVSQLVLKCVKENNLEMFLKLASSERNIVRQALSPTQMADMLHRNINQSSLKEATFVMNNLSVCSKPLESKVEQLISANFKAQSNKDLLKIFVNCASIGILSPSLSKKVFFALDRQSLLWYLSMSVTEFDNEIQHYILANDQQITFKRLREVELLRVYKSCFYLKLLKYKFGPKMTRFFEKSKVKYQKDLLERENKGTTSTNEFIIEEYLKKRGVSYEAQKSYEYNIADFYFPKTNTILEVNGDGHYLMPQRKLRPKFEQNIKVANLLGFKTLALPFWHFKSGTGKLEELLDKHIYFTVFAARTALTYLLTLF